MSNWLLHLVSEFFLFLFSESEFAASAVIAAAAALASVSVAVSTWHCQCPSASQLIEPSVPSSTLSTWYSKVCVLASRHSWAHTTNSTTAKSNVVFSPLHKHQPTLSLHLNSLTFSFLLWFSTHLTLVTDAGARVCRVLSGIGGHQLRYNQSVERIGLALALALNHMIICRSV